MADMVTVGFSDLRRNLKEYCDMATRDAQQIMVTRKGGDNMVLISEREWNAMQETLYIMGDGSMMAGMRESEADLRGGRVSRYGSMADLREELAHA